MGSNKWDVRVWDVHDSAGGGRRSDNNAVARNSADERLDAREWTRVSEAARGETDRSDFSARVVMHGVRGRPGHPRDVRPLVRVLEVEGDLSGGAGEEFGEFRREPLAAHPVGRPGEAERAQD